jgi:hypothetical protein
LAIVAYEAHVIRHALAILAILLVPADASAEQSWSGTWKYGLKGAFAGELRTIDRHGDVEFQILLWQLYGPHNSGEADGHIAIRGGKATYETTEFTDSKCRLDFTFTSTRVEIKQSEGNEWDCGFGHSISADGIYVRVNRKPPQGPWPVQALHREPPDESSASVEPSAVLGPSSEVAESTGRIALASAASGAVASPGPSLAPESSVSIGK